MALNSLYPDGWFALGAAALKVRFYVETMKDNPPPAPPHPPPLSFFFFPLSNHVRQLKVSISKNFWILHGSII